MSETAASPLSNLIDDLARAAKTAPGGKVVGSVREAGLTHFRALGLPHQRLEDWKYTSVRNIARRDFRLGAGKAEDEVIARARTLGCGDQALCTLVFVNGTLAGKFGETPPGLTVMGLAQALEERPDDVAALCGQFTATDTNGFTALNAASLLDGAYINVSPGVTVDAPVNLVFVANGTSELACMPRNLIHVGKDASVHVVEHYHGDDESVYLTNVVTEIKLDENATLEHSRLQEEGRSAYHVGAMEAVQAGGSSFTSHALSLGANIARHDINTHFKAPGARCVMNGLYLGTGRQHVDFHTQIHHEAPDCSSQQLYKGILDGHGRGVFNGQVHVWPDAQRSDAEQSNHNLLLSRNAEIDTKPQLEIYADDVKCSHGTTVGQLDDNQLFYLRSRGIPEAEARGMLTYGFAHDIAERLTVDALRERVEKVLLETLPNVDALRD